MVAEREPVRLGLLLSGSENWIGGVYYVLNLIRGLTAYKNAGGNFELYVLCTGQLPSDVYLTLDALKVNYDKTDEISLPTKFVRRMKYGANSNRHTAAFVDVNQIDILYPLLSYDLSHASIGCKVIYWIPDFQHKILPDFFSQEELLSRDDKFEKIANNAKHLILSSNDALIHFDRFYQDSKASTTVLQFKSIIDKDNLPPTDQVRVKYEIPEKYFMVANQFWAHKNHKVVLEAIKILTDAGLAVPVVFSGKPYDNRQPEYYDGLLNYIEESNLTHSVYMVGFIPREEQLTLMRGSLAVVQPSLFEGWSTVIEDAKSLQKQVICSSINIHKEQLGSKGLYFEQFDYEGLSNLLLRIFNEKEQSFEFPVVTDVKYGERLFYILKNA
jgi:glycosyltransferase involved in cell wall biosynthesis